SEEELGRLIELGQRVKAHSLCGLGQTAPNPILTTARYFPEEYTAHIRDGACPAKVCKPLLRYDIDVVACKNCRVCARQCPAAAITDGAGDFQVIDQALCAKCGRCFQVCPFGAVGVETGKVRA
ncbi:MAG: 4Fe-4S binding protein, partial [Candidatus Bipolaricaulota bacterium]|nr:4Fe-4S binding protein [Candidatus Bipolaricaulota bacterium]